MQPSSATARVTNGDTPEAALLISPTAKTRSHPLIYMALSAYALLVALTIHRHEPWSDEAQSWLLGRDASLPWLWGHLLHYEGTPGLWQTLVHALIRLGLSYSAYNFVSASLALAAVYLLLRYAPLPLFIRIALPFTYYLCYQYAVIARSYTLIAPLLFAVGAFYSQALRRMAWMTVLLSLLAAVSVHGLILSVCIWATLYLPVHHSEPRASASERRNLAIATIAYCCVLIFLVASAWPAKDVAFAEHRGLSNLHLFPAVAKAGLTGAFTGYLIASLAVIALSVPVLWRGGGWLFFLLATVAFCLFGTIVYTQLWHFGILYLAWLFAIWISASKTRVTAPTLLALIATIGFQCYWTAAAIRYDWSHAYSGSLAAAQYLRQKGYPPGGLYAIGYPATAIQPYFSSNIYSDFNDRANGAYWDWSKQNMSNDPAALLRSQGREQVLVGYKALPEKQHWADILSILGYGLTEHFDGSTFWQTGVFEFESYDLYRRISDIRATTGVNMADPAQAGQLWSGFYDIEGGKSRWTARNFSILLKAPPDSDRNGAELALKLYLPEAQIRSLGPITMSADAGGHQLPSRTFSESEETTYSAHVPAEALRSGFIAVNFRLDKSSVGFNGDARELGVVVTSITLDPAPQAR
jgi:hypothetical protein